MIPRLFAIADLFAPDAVTLASSLTTLAALDPDAITFNTDAVSMVKSLESNPDQSVNYRAAAIDLLARVSPKALGLFASSFKHWGGAQKDPGVYPKDFDLLIAYFKEQASHPRQDPLPFIESAKEAFQRGEMNETVYQLMLTTTVARVTWEEGAVSILLEALFPLISFANWQMEYEKGKIILEMKIGQVRYLRDLYDYNAEFDEEYLRVLTKFQRFYLNLETDRGQNSVAQTVLAFEQITARFGTKRKEDFYLFFRKLLESIIPNSNKSDVETLFGRAEGLIESCLEGRRKNQALNSLASAKRLFFVGAGLPTRANLLAVRKHAEAQGADNLISVIEDLVRLTPK
ncbi:MAG: hypothetical protein Q7T03_00995 [Deltaproteobacteria bacterium]|nr:hypothetical protein [Deltaproteobacteria bacterium]